MSQPYRFDVKLLREHVDLDLTIAPQIFSQALEEHRIVQGEYSYLDKLFFNMGSPSKIYDILLMHK